MVPTGGNLVACKLSCSNVANIWHRNVGALLLADLTTSAQLTARPNVVTHHPLLLILEERAAILPQESRLGN